jgi:hypothetical protein
MSDPEVEYVRPCPDKFGQQPDMSGQDSFARQKVNKLGIHCRILTKLGTNIL